jgi:hypothetical protein
VLVAKDGHYRGLHTYWFKNNRKHSGIIVCSGNFERTLTRFRRCAEYTLRGLTNAQIEGHIIWVIERPSIEGRLFG